MMIKTCTVFNNLIVNACIWCQRHGYCIH